MSVPSYESPLGDDIEAPCKWCGADYESHDYEQQARACWPKQVAELKTIISAICAGLQETGHEAAADWVSRAKRGEFLTLDCKP